MKRFLWRLVVLASLALVLALPSAAIGSDATLPETVTVDATSDEDQTTATSFNPGRSYKVVVTGATSVWADQSGVIDALYCFESERCEDRGTIPGVRFPKLRLAQSPFVGVDVAFDEFVDVGEGGIGYQSSHRYEGEFSEVSGQVKLFYEDTNYADNDGSYEVTFSVGERCSGGMEPANGAKEVIGTAGDDRLVGTPGDDIICALSGNDRIDGGGGNDLIYGGTGNDILTGGPGIDSLFGGAGNDRFIDSEAAERDTFNGGSGRDGVYYSLKRSGVVARIGGSGGERGEGDRILNSIENLYGTRFNDRLVGNGGRNILSGRDGKDRLFGRGKKDRLLGGAETDILNGGGGPDLLLGNGGGDLLAGGANDDTLKGGKGEDDLEGGGGRDRFFGEEDDDTLLARDRRIDRVLNGGPGTDTASFDSAERGRLHSVEQR